MNSLTKKLLNEGQWETVPLTGICEIWATVDRSTGVPVVTGIMFGPPTEIEVSEDDLKFYTPKPQADAVEAVRQALTQPFTPQLNPSLYD